jgi:hypothetical protein
MKDYHSDTNKTCKITLAHRTLCINLPFQDMGHQRESDKLVDLLLNVDNPSAIRTSIFGPECLGLVPCQEKALDKTADMFGQCFFLRQLREWCMPGLDNIPEEAGWKEQGDNL